MPNQHEKMSMSSDFNKTWEYTYPTTSYHITFNFRSICCMASHV